MLVNACVVSKVYSSLLKNRVILLESDRSPVPDLRNEKQPEELKAACTFIPYFCT